MKVFGRSVRRTEDAELVAGQARFLDDLPTDAYHLAVVRSPFAHARIVGVRLSQGSSVLQGWTAEDVPHLQWPHLIRDLPPRTALATDKVRYAGEPVAAVVASSARLAADAAGAAEVDLEPLDAAVTVSQAVADDAPLVYEELGTNIANTDVSDHDDDLFASSDVVVRRRFTNQRVAPAMLEGRGILAVPDGKQLTVYAGHQNPHRLHADLVEMFSLDEPQVRVVVPEVGGGFGAKVAFYPEYALVCHAALTLQHPVKFVERRTENMTVSHHGRGQTQNVEVGASTDGHLQALRVHVRGDYGAAVSSQYYCLQLTRRMLSGAYRIPRIEWRIEGVLTHTAPTGAYRGAGRPEAAYLIERGLDELARELSLDPVDLRRRNLLPPDEFPYRTPTGVTYDTGDYATALDHALAEVDYENARRAQLERRKQPARPQIGIGVATYVEMAAGGKEYARTGVNSNGRATVFVGTAATGQGHQTTWAQLAAEHLGLDLEDVDVVAADTGRVPRGGGTSGSRSAALGGSAIVAATKAVADTLRQMAAEELEAAVADIRLTGGQAIVAGTDVGVTLAALATQAGGSVSEARDFEASGQNFPFGTHICVVEVDRATGEVRLDRFVSVDDCGTVINPLVVEGQITGGIVQGIGQALSEAVTFDELGGSLSTTFVAYQVPGIGQIPALHTRRTETPTPNNPTGLKGVGELGATGSTPAVANAVYDALAPSGIGEEQLPMPFTPGRVWQALSEVGPS